METAGPMAEPLCRPWIIRTVGRVAGICPLNETFPGAETLEVLTSEQTSPSVTQMEPKLC